jgi:hypothetical protein
MPEVVASGAGRHPVQAVTRILRLAFDRRVRDVPGAPSVAELASEARSIEFVAYTDDWSLSGLIALDAARLTDLLNDADEVDLVDVVVQSLATGEVEEAARLLLPRRELVAVKAQLPRGNPAGRRPTRKHAIAFGAGRYLLHGHVHARPGADPLIDAARRAPIIPLTDATVRFSFANAWRCDAADVLLVNRDRTDWFRLAPEADIARAAASIEADEIAAFVQLRDGATVGP